MSLGEVAGLIAAIALLVLVSALIYPIVKLGKTLDETRLRVKETGPLLEEVTTTVRTSRGELERIEEITSHVQEVSGNVAGLTSLFAATLGRPLVKVAAMSYAIRQSIADRRRKDVQERVEEQMRAERAAAKAARRSKTSTAR